MITTNKKYMPLQAVEVDKSIILYRLKKGKQENLRKLWIQRHDYSTTARYSPEAWTARMEVLLEEDFKDLNHDR